jgi:ketosteroid isomerase-like protein
MSNDQQHFERFMQHRDSVARAYAQGDAKPLARIVTPANPATFFGPQGGVTEGADAVASRYLNDAKAFEANSDSHLDVLHMSAGSGLAYWVGIQRAKVQMRDKPEPTQFDLRVTELFRRDGDDWKLIHRHADALKA